MKLESIIQNSSAGKVFYFFEKISEIPRGSKKEKAISDWLVAFAKEKKLVVVQDKYLNVLIRKPATSGYENFSPLIIQGHMDMVWEKNKDVNFDFETQGIDLIINDGFITANGTTLGADNGVAVAVALALLDSDNISHPELEILITSDEEAGMSGAENFNTSLLKGCTMLNVDTDEEKTIYVSSAGGARVQIDLDFSRDKNHENSMDVILEVKGLNGGHSGADIDKNLGNSIKILSKILASLSIPFKIYDITGGEKMNAIPRESTAVLNINADSFDKIKKEISSEFEKIKENYAKTEEKLTYEFGPVTDVQMSPITDSDSKKIIEFLNELPNGIIAMSKDIKGLVEASLSLGVLRTNETSISMQFLLRSSFNKSVDIMLENLKVLSKKYGAKFHTDSSYNSWEYNENSELRELFIKSQTALTGTAPEIKAVHAGLECGILAGKMKKLDVISIGPNNYGAHTPEERLEIKSMEYLWQWILKSLELYDFK